MVDESEKIRSILRMDAQLLTSEIPADVTGWWVSEKYDGIRAIWNGRKLLSRHGREIKAPNWFLATLPQGVRLDGELWMGRGTFDKLVGVVKSGNGWEQVQYMVFDLADVGAFEDRYKTLQKMKMGKYAKVVSHWYLTSNGHLNAMEQIIVTNGGEGCVIRRPGCKYRPGRCGDVIKVKRISEDVDRWQG